MSVEEITEQLYNIIAEKTGVGMSEISQMSDFRDDLNISDLEFAEMVADIEEHFGIEFDNESIKSIRNVDDMINLLEDSLG